MGWIEHGDASYIEMKNRDIAELRAKVAALEAKRKPKCPDCNSVRMSHCSDPQNCGGVYWPDSYYRKLEAENGRLREALRDVISRISGGRLRYFGAGTGYSPQIGSAEVDRWRSILTQQPSPAQDKEQP